MHREQILQLLAHPTEANIALALSLAESQKIDLSDFWADLQSIYQYNYGAIGEQAELIDLWASEELSWNGYALTELPRELPMLRQLKRIQLNSNNFSEFPPQLLQMPWITHLMILHLSLKHYPLPPEIGRCQQLQALALACIASVPDEIGELTELLGLSLNNGSIAHLPDSIGKLQHLQALEVAHNALERLPDSLGTLHALQSLQLYHNRLQTLPDSLAQLQHLQQLGLKKNRFTDLPDWIATLPNLEYLELTENPIPAARVADLRQKMPNCEIVF